MIRTSYVWPAFVLATVLFYSAFLFSPSASIHWDLADVSYPSQNYVAQALHAGKIPHWTPFLYSGSPFLADPQVGAWVSPTLALLPDRNHSSGLGMGVGTCTPSWRCAEPSFWRGSCWAPPTAAPSAALFYAWSGYFAGRSSQLGKFEAAALLPWLLWAALEAVESGSPGSLWPWLASRVD